MYPRIENSVRWSAHPESRTDPHGQRRVGAVERAPAAGLGAPTPRMGDGGARSRSRIPRGAACRVGGRWCVLLNGDPTRPLFSRTPSPARKFAQRHRRRADRRRRLWQPVHHAAPAVGDGHGDGRVSPASWCPWCRLLLVAPQRQHGNVGGRRRRHFADRRVPRVSLAVSKRRRGGEVNEHESPRNGRISPRLHWGQRDAPSGHVGCGKRFGARSPVRVAPYS